MMAAGTSLASASCNGLLHGGQILRIDDDDPLIAIGGENVLDLQLFGNIALQREAGAGVVLMACHAGDGVVEHDGE